MISGKIVSQLQISWDTHQWCLLVAGFREILHKAIREGLEEGVDEVQANGARQLQEGWMHIHGASLYKDSLTHLDSIRRFSCL